MFNNHKIFARCIDSNSCQSKKIIVNKKSLNEVVFFVVFLLTTILCIASSLLYFVIISFFFCREVNGIKYHYCAIVVQSLSAYTITDHLDKAPGKG